MHSSNQEPGGRCPNFNQHMQACSLFTDGFYLPLRSNVLAFCLSKSYQNCPVYYKFCATQGLPEPAPGQEVPGSFSRRRYQRIHVQGRVWLFSFDQLGRTQGEFQETVWTRDLCPGGMRVVADSPIPVDTWLRFQFEEDFFVPGLQGLACLCWRRIKALEPGGVEAGLAFKDQQSTSRLCLEFGQT